MLRSICISWIVVLTCGSLIVKADESSTRFIIVGAGASGIAAARKLLESGFNNIVILEAENRIGGRIHSIPFGNGNIDLGAQWCQGETGNIVYEMVKNDFEFGDTAIWHNNSHGYTSNGKLVDQNALIKLLELSDMITSDYAGMAQYDKSLGEFFEMKYRSALQETEFEDVDKELAAAVEDFTGRGMNTLFASESWYNLSSKLNAYPELEGNQVMTWKEHGSRMVFDFLMKKLPDPSKALPFDGKIQFNKEVTNIDYTSNQIIVMCADGSKYEADHVIVTVSLGFLKKHHQTLFTPPLPAKKINAIEHIGYGTLGKLFLEFEEPFWPPKFEDWAAYMLLWTKADKEKMIGTEREWLTGVTAFIRVDSQPNLLEGLTAGKNIKEFEEISDNQLIDDCMWLLEKFLGRTLPRPRSMQRNRWQSSKYFLGTYSYLSMETEAHNASIEDLAETVHSDTSKPVLLFAGEATDNNGQGYVHGAVSSGFRVAEEILAYYKSMEH